MGDPADRRRRMVERQIAARGISDRRLLAAMARVPREAFVPPDRRHEAFDDRPLPIGWGQTISQPVVVAEMIAALGLHPGDRVLEVGAGSGYAAAVLAELGAEVFAVERLPSLAETARARLAACGYRVDLAVGDGGLGWPDRAPFDAILVSAAAPAFLPVLEGQLKEGGRLVMPVGDSHAQTLWRITWHAGAEPDRADLGAVLFVPLVSEPGPG